MYVYIYTHTHRVCARLSDVESCFGGFGREGPELQEVLC